MSTLFDVLAAPASAAIWLAFSLQPFGWPSVTKTTTVCSPVCAAWYAVAHISAPESAAKVGVPPLLLLPRGAGVAPFTAVTSACSWASVGAAVSRSLPIGHELLAACSGVALAVVAAGSGLIVGEESQGDVQSR